MAPLDPLQENRFMRTKLIIAIGLSIALATGLAIAKPRNGALGVYLDDGGNVVGTFSVSCDGVFGYSGTRTSHPVTNGQRSEEHTSELQSLMRISYAVFCLKKKNKHNSKQPQHQ